MNVGYSDDSSDGIYFKDELQAHPEIYHIQLYHYVVMLFGEIKTLKNKSLLELGGGKGGGIDYLMNELTPRKVIASDIS